MDLMYEKTNNKTGEVTSGLLKNYEADFDISLEDNCTFEIKMTAPENRGGLYFIENEINTVIYADGTEYGGVVDGYTIDFSENTITYTGRTWRGTFDDYIVEPPKGSEFRYISGSLPAVLSNFPHNKLIKFKGVGTVPRTKLERFITVKEATAVALSAAGADYIVAMRYDANANGMNGGTVTAETKKRRDLRDDVSFSQDYGNSVSLKITRDGTTPRRLICLGKGEGKDQTVLNLYADKNWNITKSTISGAAPVATYESNEDALETDARKHFKELIAAHESVDVSINGVDLELGDRIAAKDNLTGESVTAIISGIVWKKTDAGANSSETIEYKTSSGTIVL